MQRNTRLQDQPVIEASQALTLLPVFFSMVDEEAPWIGQGVHFAKDCCENVKMSRRDPVLARLRIWGSLT